MPEDKTKADSVAPAAGAGNANGNFKNRLQSVWRSLRAVAIPALLGLLATFAGAAIKLLERTERGSPFIEFVRDDKYKILDIQTELFISAFMLTLGAEIKSSTAEPSLRYVMALVAFLTVIGILCKFAYSGYPFATAKVCEDDCVIARTLWYGAQIGALLMLLVATMYAVGERSVR